MNKIDRINPKLIPLSWLYGLGVGIRNELFNMKLLPSKQFDVPVIGIGNITVGGTGKTPHVEYLIELLRKNCKVAVLSRGYMRKTKGFVLADKNSRMEEIGDEPYQMMQKYPDVTFAVDEKRVDGIKRLLALEKSRVPDVILLDDSYQHRYVKPGINILLVDYHHLISEDHLLPAGRLREPASNRDRADVIVITKCPDNMKPIDFRVLTKTIEALPYQKLFFSTIEYKQLRKIFLDNVDEIASLDDLENKNVLMLTGIASPEALHEEISKHTNKIVPLSFDDHHDFLPNDIAKINATFANMAEPKLIITTEKDEM
ncbi:MAG: tetraacyldisaccharide 4'-kinase, partial [Prevotellaceae bacterium]|nr:tetraacyldisaccharide 4'-kinase [Prevotellaceae bacterium]